MENKQDTIKKITSEELEKIYSVKNRPLPKNVVDQAKAVNIMDYLDKKGILTKRISNDACELIEHDSLKITPSKNMFNWTSRGFGGYGAVGFAVKVLDMNYREAVRDVLEHADEMIVPIKDKEKTVEDKEPYKYNPNIMSHETNKVEEYLVKERQLNPDLVEKLIDKGMIRQTTKTIKGQSGKEVEVNNVAFMWQRHGQIIGHDERGIAEGSSFKKIASGVPEHRGFSVTFGKAENLFVFESNIDALSYATLYPPKNSRFISMNGANKHRTAHQAIGDILQETGKLPDHVVICTDNDRAGLECIKNIAQPLEARGQTVNFSISQPPRFFKEHLSEKQGIEEIVKSINKYDFPENNLSITAEGMNIEKDGIDRWHVIKGKDRYRISDNAADIRKLNKLFSDTEFNVEYDKTTKDWNEVLKHINENDIILERPYEPIKFSIVEERVPEKEDNKKLQRNDKGMER